MAERDRFELDLAAALRAYLEDAPTEVRPTEIARQLATAYPHRQSALGRWGFGLTPAMAWVLLLVGLLLALLVGGLLVGIQRPDQAVVVVPQSPGTSPTPARSPSPWGTATAWDAPRGAVPFGSRPCWGTEWIVQPWSTNAL